MRTHGIRIVALSIVLFPLIGCGLSNEEAEPPQPAANAAAPAAGPEVAQPPADVIVFRGRYYQEKRCRKLPDGGWACGPVVFVEVVEVLRGDLELKLLELPILAAGPKEGTYTFRWKRSDAIRQEVRTAEQKGFTSMWIGEKLELVTP